MFRRSIPMLLLTAMLVAAGGSAVAAGAAPDADKESAEPSKGPSPTTKAKWTRLVGNTRMGRRAWVAGVTVLVTPEWTNPNIYVTSTDEKGIFRLDQLEEGRYEVQFLKYGLATIRKTDVELEFPFQAVVEVVMESATGPVPPVVVPARGSADDAGTASVLGLMVGRDGDPIAEVRVRMVKADGTVDPVFVMSDETGNFEVNGLAPGLWNLEIRGAGYLPVRAPASLFGETGLRAVLVPQPATYEPQPLDLMPPEEPIPPMESLEGEATASAAEGP